MNICFHFRERIFGSSAKRVPHLRPVTEDRSKMVFVMSSGRRFGNKWLVSAYGDCTLSFLPEAPVLVAVVWFSLRQGVEQFAPLNS